VNYKTVNTTPHPTLTVVIPVKPFDNTIQACLDALADSCYDEFEVVLMLDGWDDRGRIRWKGDQPFRKERHAKAGPSACRHQGALLASGAWICFLDSDVLVMPGTLSGALALLQRNGEDGLVGSYDDDPPNSSVCSRFRNLLHHFHHQRNEGAVGVFWGAFSIIRRERYLLSGGFDARRYRQASIEDIELGYRMLDLGMTVRLHPSIQVKHLKHWTLRNMIYTDIFLRAKPWTELLLTREGKQVSQLNLSNREKLSALTTMALYGSLALGVVVSSWYLLGICLALGLFLLLQRRFYRFGASRFDLRQLPLVFLLHHVYFMTAISGYMLGQASVRRIKLW
jgi:glycosyltransferase involved in cell wall biosynthesis